MHQIIKSKTQQKQFQKTWEYFCKLHNWYNDPYSKEAIRFNLYESPSMKKAIGTIEFAPYHPNNTERTIELNFPFSTLPYISQHQQDVWEIDKLCLHKDYHRKGYFTDFLLVMYEHASLYQPKYYIGIMEKKFFRMIRMTLNVPIEKVGEELTGDFTTLVPVCINVEAVMKNKPLINQLLKAGYESKRKPIISNHTVTSLHLLSMKVKEFLKKANIHL